MTLHKGGLADAAVADQHQLELRDSSLATPNKGVSAAHEISLAKGRGWGNALTAGKYVTAHTYEDCGEEREVPGAGLTILRGAGGGVLGQMDWHSLLRAASTREALDSGGRVRLTGRNEAELALNRCTHTWSILYGRVPVLSQIQRQFWRECGSKSADVFILAGI